MNTCDTSINENNTFKRKVNSSILGPEARLGSSGLVDNCGFWVRVPGANFSAGDDRGRDGHGGHGQGQNDLKEENGH